MATYGAFILPSLYIGRRLSTSLDVALHRWAMPQRRDLASLCIGRQWSLNAPLWCVQTSIVLHRPTSVDASLLWDYPCYAQNIHNVQSCCERLASADVDRCTAMKSECTIGAHNNFIVVHRKFRLSIVKPSYLGPALVGWGCKISVRVLA